MKLTKFLEENSYKVSALTENLGITVKEYDDRYVFNYNQIESPKTHPVVVECRGIILDKQFNIICRPFNRFFNFGEAPDTQKQLDMSKAIAFEKVDGSLIKIYHHKQWEIATRGTAFAESNVGDFNLTFRQLVLKALDMSEEEFQIKANSVLNKDVSYCFEVTAMENRVVTFYEGHTLHYLGARITSTGEYVSASELNAVKALGAKEIAKYQFSTPEQAVTSANSLGGLQEGFVVWQEIEGEFQPVCKIKAEAYLTVHAIRGEGLTQRRIAELVLTGEEDEYLTYFSEDRKHFIPYVDAFQKLKYSVESEWNKVKEIKDQKEFALAVKHLPFSASLFKAKKTKQPATHCFNEARLSWRVEILKGYVQ